MKILLLGKNGQVGWELQRALAPLGELVALDRKSVGPGLCGDLSNLANLAETIRIQAPDVIVNAAAYTAVDKAEFDREESEIINARAVEVIANEASRLGSLFVHYSTDYVFNGRGDHAWCELDEPSPLNHYGVTKLDGERCIEASGCHYLIVRTSWVYGARKNNFATTMLRLAAEHEELKVINDQIGVPTGADLLADVVAHMISKAVDQKNLSGIYHLCAAGETSWCEYAKFVINVAKEQGVPIKNKSVLPISTAEYETIAERPLNSRLNTEKLRTAFGLHLPEWREGVIRMLKEHLK
jgi:dTDP-4-dehydrorhamnose reductase